MFLKEKYRIHRVEFMKSLTPEERAEYDAKLKCLDCGRDCGMYKLKNETWLELTEGQRKLYLCIYCADIRMTNVAGRALVITDFDHTKRINDIVTFAYNRGVLDHLGKIIGSK